MLSLILEILFTATIAGGVLVVAGPGAALIAAGAIGLALAQTYGLDTPPGDDEGIEQ